MNPHYATIPTSDTTSRAKIGEPSQQQSFAICTMYNRETTHPCTRPSSIVSNTLNPSLNLSKVRKASFPQGLNTSVFRAAAYMRPILQHLRRSLILVLFEVLHEQATEFLDLGSEIRGTVPRLGGVEQFVRHVGACFWYGEAEGVVGFEFDFGELAGVDGVEDCAGVF
jgi:hypothetical protein